MAITVGEQAIVDSLNTASTKIGDRIAALIAAEPNITPEGQAAFAEVVAKLTALGTDPNNPVPANVTSFTKGRP